MFRFFTYTLNQWEENIFHKKLEILENVFISIAKVMRTTLEVDKEVHAIFGVRPQTSSTHIFQ